MHHRYSRVAGSAGLSSSLFFFPIRRGQGRLAEPRQQAFPPGGHGHTAPRGYADGAGGVCKRRTSYDNVRLVQSTNAGPML